MQKAGSQPVSRAGSHRTNGKASRPPPPPGSVGTDRALRSARNQLCWVRRAREPMGSAKPPEGARLASSGDGHAGSRGVDNLLPRGASRGDERLLPCLQQDLPSLQCERPEGLVLAHLPVRREPDTPIQALRPRVVRVHRQPNLVTTRSGRSYVGKSEFHCGRPDAVPLPSDVNREVKQLYLPSE
jgi:hypothetical protein